MRGRAREAARRLSALACPAAAALAGAAAIVIAATARAQVIVHPNQIVGSIELTNTNPAVLAILNHPLDTPPGLGYGFYEEPTVFAYSRPPQSPQLSHETEGTRGTRLRASYELTVESGPPGSGIAYDVVAWADLYHGSYWFARQASDPVEHEPAPDVGRDLRECAGIIEITARDPAGSPVTIQGGRADAYDESAPGSGLFPRVQASHFLDRRAREYLVVRGGVRHLVKLRLRLGSDPYLDLIEVEVVRELDVGCDVVVPLVIETSGGSGGSGGLARITGNVDVLGESEHLLRELTQVQAREGPWRNYRLHHVDRDPSSGAYELPNLMPSDIFVPYQPYQVFARLGFRTGRRYEYFETPSVLALAPSASTVDLGDALVIDPGAFHGDILLAGPPVQDPAIGSALADLYRSSDDDRDGDGVPDDPYLTIYPRTTVAAAGVDGILPGRTENGRATAIFAGDYDPATASFRGDYELLAGGPSRGPGNWKLSWLNLEFRDQATPAVPLSYLRCRYQIHRYDAPAVRLDPGSRHQVPLHYCFGQLNLRFESLGGSFVDPRVEGEGAFAGFDFEGNDVHYRTRSLQGHGAPESGPGVTEALVVLPLPEGVYSFSPHVTALNPGGGTSDVALPPVQIEVGCRQVVDAWLDFHLGLVAPRPCTTADQVTLAGLVTGPEAIDRIEYSNNGGPAVVHCAPCGVAPAYSFTLPLDPGANVVVITAHGSSGRSSSVRSEIERVPVPGRIGNELTAVREGIDARFRWRMAPTRCRPPSGEIPRRPSCGRHAASWRRSRRWRASTPASCRRAPAGASSSTASTA